MKSTHDGQKYLAADIVVIHQPWMGFCRREPPECLQDGLYEHSIIVSLAVTYFLGTFPGAAKI